MENNSLKVTAVKPIKQIQELLDSFMKVWPICKAKPGQRLQLMLQNKKMCFLLITGECDVKRSGDSMILITIKAPTLLGISDVIPDSSNVIIQAKDSIKYIHIPLSDFLLHVENHNLWKAVSYSLMLVSSRFNDYMKSNLAVSNYELICNQLRSLSDESFETRATTSAVQYIMDRTSLSRSGIMKTLSELNMGEYIVIKRGLLIKINKLPKKF